MADTAQNLLSQEVCDKIDQWIAKFPADRKQSAVLPVLHIVQDAHQGWLTTELMDAVANYLEMPRVGVYEVASFYSMFETKPVGRHKICICTNISCLLCGSDGIVDHIKKKLGISWGETTPDGKFSLKQVECLAACGGAPAMQIGRKYYENLTPEKIDIILAELE